MARAVRGAGPEARYTAAAVDVGMGLDARGRLGRAVPAAAPAEQAPEDEVLVARLARGDDAALAALYDRYGRVVYGLAVHLLSESGTAEEVVQETFLKLWRRPAAYQPTRGRLQPWLLGVAHHHAVDLLRRRRLELRHRALDQSRPSGGAEDALDRAPPVDDGADPAALAGWAERRRTVVGALGELPIAQRIPIELAYFRGLTQAEIAQHLGEPLGTIKTRMRLGLLRLRAAPGIAELWSER